MIIILRTLISFDFLKILKKKKNMIALMAFIVLLIVYAVICLQASNGDKESELTICQETLNQVKSDVLTLKSSSSTSDPNEEPLKFSMERQSILEKRKTALLNDDWKSLLETKIQENQNMIRAINDGTLLGEDDTKTLQSDINKYQFLLSHNIKPVVENFSMQGFFFLKNAFKDIFPLFFIILIFILTSDCISSEIDLGSYKLIYTQPISKNKILLSKYITSVIFCAVSTILILGIFFVILGLTQGFGSPDYPVSFNNSMLTILNVGNNQNISTVPIITLLVYIIPMMLLEIIAIGSISLLISSICNNSVGSISVSIILTIALYAFTFQTKLLAPISPLLPFTYTNIPGLLDGSVSQELNNSMITYYGGIIVLVFYTVICYISSAVIFRRKEIKG